MKFFKKMYGLSRSSLLRSIAAVATGTALAQVITLLFTPIITRLYGPETFGVQSVFMSFAGILASVAALTLPMAVVLPQDDDDAYGLARLSILTALVMSTLTAIVFLFFGPQILSLTNSQAINDYVYLLPLFMFFSALSATLGQWLIRKQLFGATAKISTWQALALNGAKTIAGLIQPSTLVLIVINTFGIFIQALMYIPALQKPLRGSRKETKPSISLRGLVIAYRDFPLLRAPQVLLNTASMSLPLIIFASLFGPASAAFYSIAMTALGAPSSLIGNAVSQVFYPKFNKAVLAEQNCQSMLIRSTMGMVIAGLPIFALAAVASPYLFGMVFGEKWEKSGEYAQWLSFWLFFAFINRPSVAALPVLRMQGFFLCFELISFIARIAALYIGATFFSSELATIICFSLVGGLINAALVGCTMLRAARYNPSTQSQRLSQQTSRTQSAN